MRNAVQRYNSQPMKTTNAPLDSLSQLGVTDGLPQVFNIARNGHQQGGVVATSELSHQRSPPHRQRNGENGLGDLDPFSPSTSPSLRSHANFEDHGELQSPVMDVDETQFELGNSTSMLLEDDTLMYSTSMPELNSSSNHHRASGSTFQNEQNVNQPGTVRTSLRETNDRRVGLSQELRRNIHSSTLELRRNEGVNDDMNSDCGLNRSSNNAMRGGSGMNDSHGNILHYALVSMEDTHHYRALEEAHQPQHLNRQANVQSHKIQQSRNNDQRQLNPNTGHRNQVNSLASRGSADSNRTRSVSRGKNNNKGSSVATVTSQIRNKPSRLAKKRKVKAPVSGVWNYFTRLKQGDDILAACNACQWTTKLHSSSTSNLRRHLSKKHNLSKEDLSLEIGALDASRSAFSATTAGDVNSRDMNGNISNNSNVNNTSSSGNDSNGKQPLGTQTEGISARLSFQLEAERTNRRLSESKRDGKDTCKSKVWKYFSRVELSQNTLAVCSHCQFTTKIHDSSTSNLQRHLLNVHSIDINAEPKAKPVVKQSSVSTSTKQTVSTVAKQQLVKNSNEKPVVAKKRSLETRQRNNNVVNPKRQAVGQSLEQIEGADEVLLTNLHVPDYASMVSMLRFLSSHANPQVGVSIRASKEVMLKKIQLFVSQSCASSVALSFDSWSEYVLPGHTNVIAHWIDNDWVRRSVIISCLKRSSTEEFVNQVVGDLEYLNLAHRIIAVCSNHDSLVTEAVNSILSKCGTLRDNAVGVVKMIRDVDTEVSNDGKTSGTMSNSNGSIQSSTLCKPSTDGGEASKAPHTKNKAKAQNNPIVAKYTPITSKVDEDRKDMQVTPACAIKLGCIAHVIFTEIENCQHFSYEECGKLFDLLDLWHRVPKLHGEFEAQKNAAQSEEFGVAPDDNSLGVDLNSPWHKKYGILYDILDHRTLLESTCEKIKAMDLSDLDIDFDPYILSEREWAMVKLTVEFFRLGVTMARLEGDKYVFTLSMLRVLHVELISQCDTVQELALDKCELLPSSRIVRAVNRIRSRVEQSSQSIQNKFVDVAVLLDPRVDALQHINTATEASCRAQLLDLIQRSKALRMTSLPGRNNPSQNESTRATLPRTESGSTQDSSGKRHFGPGLSGRTDEELVDAFRKLKLDPSMDIFAWWKLHHARFPRLAQVAREYLPVSCFSFCSAVTDQQEVDKIPLLLKASEFGEVLDPTVLSTAFLVRSWDIVLRTQAEG